MYKLLSKKTTKVLLKMIGIIKNQQKQVVNNLQLILFVYTYSIIFYDI
jgi:hypothetical protein